MPSPFPGMDPYLENPSRWSDVHQALISVSWLELNAALPRGYRAHFDERLYVVDPERDLYPDLVVTEASTGAKRSRAKARGKGAALFDPPRVVTARAVEIREAYLEIRRGGEDGKVVTVLEFLSPTNKRKGHPGRELYLAKQRELLRSPVHFIEIDLLRRGLHTVACPRALLNRPENAGYVVCLHRGGEGQTFALWEFTVRQALPRISVPLLPGDEPVVLNLQAVLNRCYDTAYAGDVNYRRNPARRLNKADAAWADALLCECGLRPAH